MELTERSFLVLGGWGLVGTAICRKLLEYRPKRLIVTSLRREEAEEAVAKLRAEFPDIPPETIQPAWGNLFVRHEWKDTPRSQLLADPETRMELIRDILEELTPQMLEQSALYRLLVDTQPDGVIDCINTATAIAYQDVYSSGLDLLHQLEQGMLEQASVEHLLASLYIPQLIRHIQILFHGLKDAGTAAYIKIGTSGTGGMGLNIPYTHSEERPSRVLLSKSCVAGAHTLLLFLMARTPHIGVVKEIKPAGLIAWKRIGYGEIYRKGQPIPLYDMPVNQALSLQSPVTAETTAAQPLGKNLESVFIDTGENGIFARSEFETVSTLQQMELVTPEDIADAVIYELQGGNTGYDIIQALDGAVLEPTYRGGFLREYALRTLKKLEEQHQCDSVAFELLGPPRLSKLLYEAYMLRRVARTPQTVVEMESSSLQQALYELLQQDQQLRSEILSIGLAILLPDGTSYLRGKELIVPHIKPGASLEVTPERLEQWCYAGWIDLRLQNVQKWQDRIRQIIEQVNAIPENDTSSRYAFTREYWEHFRSLHPGKLVAWILHFEEGGWRMKG